MAEYTVNAQKWPNNQETHINNAKNDSQKFQLEPMTLGYCDK